MSNQIDNTTRGARENARDLLRSSWAVVRDIAHGVDSLSAVQHGGRPAQRADRHAAGE